MHLKNNMFRKHISGKGTGHKSLVRNMSDARRSKMTHSHTDRKSPRKKSG
jgi:hypothetical protein